MGDEGGFAPDLDSNEAALEILMMGIEAAGYEAGRDAFIALDPATSELYENGAYVLEHEGRTLSARRSSPTTGRVSATAIRWSRSRTAWTRRTGTAGRAHRAARRPGPARRRRPVRDQPRAPEPGHRGGGRQLDPGQAEPDRHADRDAGDDRDRPRRGLHDSHLASLRGDRGHDDRGHRGRHRRRPDQDRRAVALGPRGEVQPAAADLGGARGESRSIPGSRPSPAGRTLRPPNHEA